MAALIGCGTARLPGVESTPALKRKPGVRSWDRDPKNKKEPPFDKLRANASQISEEGVLHSGFAAVAPPRWVGLTRLDEARKSPDGTASPPSRPSREGSQSV